jgi:uncharacterized protein
MKSWKVGGRIFAARASPVCKRGACAGRVDASPSRGREFGRALLAVIFLATFAAGARADPLGDAGGAFARGDYDTASRLMRPLADAGNPTAQLLLGFMYQGGLGLAENDGEAVRWYYLSANQGNALAQHNLGVLYANGQGVAQDYAAAAKWYRLAADQGVAEAQANLGYMYDIGQGVAQDYAQAAQWFRKAADQGHALAQYNLAVLCANGQGLPRDDREAYKWFTLAATRFLASEEDRRAQAARDRDRVASRMSAADIAEALKQAAEWRPQ